MNGRCSINLRISVYEECYFVVICRVVVYRLLEVLELREEIFVSGCFCVMVLG